MLKKGCIFLLICAFVVSISACRSIAIQQYTAQNGGSELLLNGKQYDFFAYITDGELMGDQVGVVQDMPLSKIYAVVGHPSKNWILGNLTGSGNFALYKEKSVETIPGDLAKYKTA